MTLGERLKELRRMAGVSQEAIGAQGFVSTPGWIKIENGQRSASEKLIGKFVDWLVLDKHVLAKGAAALRTELLVLKYLTPSPGHPFLLELARVYVQGRPGLAHLIGPKAKAAKR